MGQTVNTALRVAETFQQSYLNLLRSMVVPRVKLPYRYASLFCGGGGLDLGFALAGFCPAYSSDLVPQYVDTIRQNLPGHHVEAQDVSTLSGKRLLESAGGQVDVLIGGPPCQSFSILGSRGSTQDPRGQLVYDYARLIRDVQPRAFLLENVPGIMTVNRGEDWRNLLEYFAAETGFFLLPGKLNAADYGAPQIRQRVFLLGFREEAARSAFEWPIKTHADENEYLKLGLNPYRHASEALSAVDNLPNHVLRVHCDRVRNRYSLIEQGGRDRKDHTDRIHPDRPSGTVLVGSGAGGGRPFIHPHEHRHITVREAARLQTFPDWWVFAGGPTAAYRQVGNAVPPLMARAVALSVSAALRKK